MNAAHSHGLRGTPTFLGCGRGGWTRYFINPKPCLADIDREGWRRHHASHFSTAPAADLTCSGPDLQRARAVGVVQLRDIATTAYYVVSSPPASPGPDD